MTGNQQCDCAEIKEVTKLHIKTLYDRWTITSVCSKEKVKTKRCCCFLSFSIIAGSKMIEIQPQRNNNTSFFNQKLK